MERTGTECQPSEIAVKSFFLGPKAENGDWLRQCLDRLLDQWFAWRQSQSCQDSVVITEHDKATASFLNQQQHTERMVCELAKKFEAEIPKFSPRYVGHMFSEISMPAFLGHILTLMHNPNNLSPEASTVGVEIERHAIEQIKDMIGFRQGLGHFTSGGTVANFEFLNRARERIAVWLAASALSGRRNILESAHMGWEEFRSLGLSHDQCQSSDFYYLSNPMAVSKKLSTHFSTDFAGPVLIVPASKHYSWPKAAHFLGLGEGNLRYIELDKYGRASSSSLNRIIDSALLEDRPIAGVVAISGTTELGSIDPLAEFTDLLAQYKQKHGLDIWLHADAAYGGFLCSLLHHTSSWPCYLGETALSHLAAVGNCHSVTLDPHKLGYVPYSSGVFVVQDRADYFIRSFTGPYLANATETLGNFTLEGSRSAAGAVATWLSMESLKFSDGYAQVLNRSIHAKQILQEELKKKHSHLFIPEALDSNILCFAPLGPHIQTLSQVNQQVYQVYREFNRDHEYWISKTVLRKKDYGQLIEAFCQQKQITRDSDELVLIRLTIMNPFILSKESKIDHLEQFCRKLSDSLSRMGGPITQVAL